MRRPGMLLFPIIYCLVYVTLYKQGIATGIYYPKLGSFFLEPQPPSAGPSMLYFGWAAAALLGAGVIVAAIPHKWAERVPRSLSWAAPLAALCYVLYHERVWLMP